MIIHSQFVRRVAIITEKIGHNKINSQIFQFSEHMFVMLRYIFKYLINFEHMDQLSTKWTAKIPNETKNTSTGDVVNDGDGGSIIDYYLLWHMQMIELIHSFHKYYVRAIARSLHLFFIWQFSSNICLVIYV